MDSCATSAHRSITLLPSTKQQLARPSPPSWSEESAPERTQAEHSNSAALRPIPAAGQTSMDHRGRRWTSTKRHANDGGWTDLSIPRFKSRPTTKRCQEPQLLAHTAKQDGSTASEFLQYQFLEASTQTDCHLGWRFQVFDGRTVTCWAMRMPTSSQPIIEEILN